MGLGSDGFKLEIGSKRTSGPAARCKFRWGLTSVQIQEIQGAANSKADTTWLPGQSGDHRGRRKLQEKHSPRCETHKLDRLNPGRWMIC